MEQLREVVIVEEVAEMLVLGGAPQPGVHSLASSA